SLVLAAARIGDADKLDEARAGIAQSAPIELAFGHARAGVHTLDLPDDGAVPRALWSVSWPLALLGRPSELRLAGPNHAEGVATFHDLRLAWAPLAARFGLKVSLELLRAGFAAEMGELSASLDPAPALTPLHVVHRGILRQVALVAATAEGRDEEPLRAAQAAARKLRAHGVNAESERVPLPHSQGARAGRWALTAVAEFENSVVSASALGTPRERPALLGPESPQAPEAVGEKVAERIGRFLSGGGAIDGRMAQRPPVPTLRPASGLGALGDLSKARGRRRIDLHGLVVCPGFIDLLGQSELEVLVDPRAESKIRQGITSELTGEGISPAPMTPGWVHENEDVLRKFKL